MAAELDDSGGNGKARQHLCHQEACDVKQELPVLPGGLQATRRPLASLKCLHEGLGHDMEQYMGARPLWMWQQIRELCCNALHCQLCQLGLIPKLVANLFEELAPELGAQV